MLHVVRKRMGRPWMDPRRRVPSASALALATLLATLALAIPGRTRGAGRGERRRRRIAAMWRAVRRGRRPRRRTLAFLAAALVLPGQALALDGAPLPFTSTAPAEGGSTPAELAVWATLDSCAGKAPRIACTISVSYTEIPDAASYTLALIGPEGSILHRGGVAGGGATVTVPYVGDGTYVARVSAYAAPAPDADRDPHATRAHRGRLIATAIATSGRPSGDEGPGDGAHTQGGHANGEHLLEPGADPGAPAPSIGSVDAGPGAASDAGQSPAEQAQPGASPAEGPGGDQPVADPPPEEQPAGDCEAAEQPPPEETSTEGMEAQEPAAGPEPESTPDDGAPPPTDSSASGEPTTTAEPLDAEPADCPQA